MMTVEEANTFEKDPLFSEIILMRRWDEQAKIQDKPIPDLNHFHKLIVHHLIS
jgi:predicted HD phosphohydrolase